MMEWAYGVTTVPARYSDYLHPTLDSLSRAGFSSPRLFVDGELALPFYASHHSATYRGNRIGAFGNWCLGMMELFLRHPKADRYVMFQDDLIASRNMREYLEHADYPRNGYCNLYTVPVNERPDWLGFYPSDQRGKGALALMFDNETLRTLLTQRHVLDHTLDERRGDRCIDGCVVTALRKAGIAEFVHSPSLVQHKGLLSAIGNKFKHVSTTFRGEDYDLMEVQYAMWERAGRPN